jgi:hypothetical protein
MKGRRSFVVLIVVASLMTVGTYVVCHPFGMASLRRRAALIKPGDDKNHVRAVLGRPALTSGVSPGPERWAYESPLHDWNWHRPAGDFPWIVSMNLSLSPDANDVLVHFNADRVAKVYIPLK